MRKIKLLIHVILLMSMITIIPVSKLLAQEVPLIPPTEHPAITSVGELDTISQMLATTGGYLLLIMIVTGWLISRLNANSTFKQVFSWVVAFGIAYGGRYYHLGIFDGLSLTYTALYALTAGAVSNKWFDSGTFDNILVFLKSMPSTARDSRKAS